ncbi:torsin-1A-like [Liolophura sinensis]|uniref:torsin-1A-like n=1 Tax=Liolophura sinensis TaxID=3198878 RepID=UPI0031586384
MLVAVMVGMVVMLLTNSIVLNVSRSRPVNRRLTGDDISLLEKNLREKVFGQHIARKVVVDMLKTVTSVDHETRQLHDGVKMAVLSLHGWTGVGKTFLTQQVLNSLNPEKFIRYIIPIHFPHSLDDETSETVILDAVTSNISQSAVSVIIFDEMDKASRGVLEGIAKSLLHIKIDNSCSNATVIVLFVSNSQGQKLNNRLFKLLSQGKRREDLQSADFDEVFRPSLMADGDIYKGYPGEYWYDVFTNQGLIDTFVPFLPLNLAHVQQCVHHSLQEKGMKPTVDLVDGITRELSLFQPTGLTGHYSQTGCKRVSEKVDLHSDHLF